MDSGVNYDTVLLWSAQLLATTRPICFVNSRGLHYSMPFQTIVWISTSVKPILSQLPYTSVTKFSILAGYLQTNHEYCLPKQLYFCGVAMLPGWQLNIFLQLWKQLLSLDTFWNAVTLVIPAPGTGGIKIVLSCYKSSPLLDMYSAKQQDPAATVMAGRPFWGKERLVSIFVLETSQFSDFRPCVVALRVLARFIFGTKTPLGMAIFEDYPPKSGPRSISFLAWEIWSMSSQCPRKRGAAWPSRSLITERNTCNALITFILRHPSQGMHLPTAFLHLLCLHESFWICFDGPGPIRHRHGWSTSW